MIIFTPAHLVLTWKNDEEKRLVFSEVVGSLAEVNGFYW